MKKLLPAVGLATILLLTGCSNTNNTTADKNSATPTPTPYSTTKITPAESALGDSNIKIPTDSFSKDGSFTTPTIEIDKASPAPTASVEEVKTFTDFKTIITNSINKMLETGVTQPQTQGSTSMTYVIVKTSPTAYKAAVQFNGKTIPPDLLQTINMFIPVVAETSLNSVGATYSISGETITVKTSIGIYTFGITNGLITSMNITGNDTVKSTPLNATISYSTDANAKNIADTAVLPPY